MKKKLEELLKLFEPIVAEDSTQNSLKIILRCMELEGNVQQPTHHNNMAWLREKLYNFKHGVEHVGKGKRSKKFLAWGNHL